jgi:predicted transcriptional regulator
MDANNRKSLSSEQLDLIERFLSAYNAIDHSLRAFLRKDTNVPFTQLIRDYYEKYPVWREQENLRMIGDLRNVVVHQREQSYGYLSVPVPWIVENTERIRDQFNSPKGVFPDFQRNVLTFQTTDELSIVLKSINKNDFSQFPIYQNEKYIGLLTENGITRWFAKYSTKVMTLVDFSEIIIENVLNLEEQRKNYLFIPRNSSILDVKTHFMQNMMLEALLITEKGKPSERLIGIITRWDVLNL